MTSPSNTVHILLVDDDAMSRELLSALLTERGYRVKAAESGDAALRWLASGRCIPQAVLADVQMPGISGSQLADALRLHCGPQTLLLAMSGSGPLPSEVSRFDGFLLKPFTMDQIASALGTISAMAAASLSAAASKKSMNGSLQEAHTVPTGTPVGTADPDDSFAEGKKPAVGTRAKAPANQEKPRTAVLDERIYSQLAEAMPGKQLKQMYFMCMRDARDRIATMRRLADEHDETQFGRQAHAIKGGCGMLGASELYGMAARLETFGLHTPAPQGVNPLDELSAACDRLERILGSRL